MWPHPLGRHEFDSSTQIGGIPGIAIDQADGSIAPVRVSVSNAYYGAFFTDTLDFTSQLSDKQRRRGLRRGWTTEYTIAGPAEASPGECGVPDPMGAEVPLPGQLGRANVPSSR